MSQKRMFDKSILETDAFADLPMSAKALYFLLGMEADDEGFVSPKRVIKLYGGNDDDTKVLIAKNFVIPFQSGVVVITNWKENNYLDKNRIKPTRYQEEKKLLALNEHNQYVLNIRLTSVKPTLNGCLTSIEENRIEQNRTENSKELEQSSDNKKENKSLSDEKKEYGNPEVNQAMKELENLLGTKPQRIDKNRQSAHILIRSKGLNRLIKAINFAFSVREDKFAPNVTNYIDLQTKWDQLETYAMRKGNQGGRGVIVDV